MAEPNPYLSLMDDDEPKKKGSEIPSAPKPSAQAITPDKPLNPTSNQILPPEILKALDAHNIRSPMSSLPPQGEPVVSEQSKNPYQDLLEDETKKPANAQSVLSSGIGASREAIGPVAERITGAPAGSVAEINALINPKKAAMTPAVAARLAAEARNPAPVTSGRSGANWLKNWANQNPEGFVGGIPEAAGHYERGKWHGKISSRISKMYPHGLTGEGSAIAEAAANESNAARAAQVAKEAQSSGLAARLTGPLSIAGRVLGALGIGSGGVDVYNRAKEGDTQGATVGALGTAASAAAPFVGPALGIPLAGAGALLPAYQYMQDNPEVKKKFLEGMSGKSAYSNRGFGLD
jgi:hypothetical protein